jgi:hypothetical protein
MDPAAMQRDLDRDLDRAGPVALESFKATITAGQNALRTGILINGGAAAGLLTFLGSIVTKPEGASLKHPLAIALLFFGLGVLACAVALAFVYLTQWVNSRQVEAAVKSIEACKVGRQQEAATFRREREEQRTRANCHNCRTV